METVYTVYWTLVGCGAASWLLTHLLRRVADRRERIKACEPHDRYLAESHEPLYPIYRCRRCPWQAPAADEAKRRYQERQARLDQLRCPDCRKVRDADPS